jgi:hypothetical protein
MVRDAVAGLPERDRSAAPASSGHGAGRGDHARASWRWTASLPGCVEGQAAKLRASSVRQPFVHRERSSIPGAALRIAPLFGPALSDHVRAGPFLLQAGGGGAGAGRPRGRCFVRCPSYHRYEPRTPRSWFFRPSTFAPPSLSRLPYPPTRRRQKRRCSRRCSRRAASFTEHQSLSSEVVGAGSSITGDPRRALTVRVTGEGNGAPGTVKGLLTDAALEGMVHSMIRSMPRSPRPYRGSNVCSTRAI